MPRFRATVALALMLTSLCGRSGAEVIDRVIAVVDGRLITLSDVRTVNALALLDPAAPTAPLAQGADATIERLIDRVLVLREVERYEPAPPEAAAIDAAVARVAERTGSPAALLSRLAALGVSAAWLRQWLTDDLRIQSYITQRFANAVQPSDDDLESYLREHRTEFASRDLNDAAVLTAVRAQLVSIRRGALLAEWVTGLRRRADVTRPMH